MWRGVFASYVVLLLLISGAMLDSAEAYHFKVIHSFCEETNCADGYDLVGGLTMDRSGRLYGVADLGGTSAGNSGNPGGTVFELEKAPDGRWHHKILHSFCGPANCPDGMLPSGPPIIDRAGDLIGTTAEGGCICGTNNNGYGVIYELTPSRDHKTWLYKVLYTFCADGSCPDGGVPLGPFVYNGSAAGAPWDGTSPLYAVAVEGGPSNYAYQEGNVFSFTQTSQGTWNVNVIYSFCAVFNVVCQDGATPRALVMVSPTHFYGTTSYGGSGIGVPGHGVVYELKYKGGSWTESVLYAFCKTTFCPDGASPNGSIVLMNRKVFGTTVNGGHNNNICCGAIFDLERNSSQWQEQVMYSFCTTDCSDGAYPQGGLVMDGRGNLLGTTDHGGIFGQDIWDEGGGVVFALKKNGDYKIVHSFCSKDGCLDGEYGEGPLISDGAGGFYGTAAFGGKNGGGVVFQLTP